MLKPSDPAMIPAGPGEERPVGELVHQLVEDGKAYAQAELGLVKAIAAQKAGVLALPVALFVVAFVLVQAGVNALAVGVLLAIEPALGPLLSGLLAFLIFGAVAGGLAWWAIKRIKQDL
jgi:hypothetical protein